MFLVGLISENLNFGEWVAEVQVVRNDTDDPESLPPTHLFEALVVVETFFATAYHDLCNGSHY
jgi:hypothetical protein